MQVRFSKTENELIGNFMWASRGRSLTAFLTISASTFPLLVRSFQQLKRPGIRLLMMLARNGDLPPPLIDVDCNLIHKDLKPLFEDSRHNDLPPPFQILQQDSVKQANIVAVLSPSSTIEEAKAILDLLPSSPELPSIRTTVGVHPYHVTDEGPTLEQQMEICADLLEKYAPHIAAVGECGLDSSEGFPSIDDQIPWFQAQIALAEKFQKPLFVHERLAHEKTMELLADCAVPVIIHCFTGNLEECEAYVERGYYISLSGFICKENEEALTTLNCLNTLPLGRLMLETDAPYMGFRGCRDLYLEKNSDLLAELNSKNRKRLANSFYPNVPSSLTFVLDRVVETMRQSNDSITRDEVAWQTSKNANRFFQFKIGGLD